MKIFMNEGHLKVPKVVFLEAGVLITNNVSRFSHQAETFFFNIFLPFCRE
jgi:hypothetical protein